MKLLVADDDVVYQQLYERLLGKEFELTIAGKGAQAWDRLRYDSSICVMERRLAFIERALNAVPVQGGCRRNRPQKSFVRAVGASATPRLLEALCQ
jgi:hypothetical protein